MSSVVKHMERQMMGESFFLYNAFAPMQANTRDKERQKEVADNILVKVGISSIPMNRIYAVHVSCPFRVAYAAFTNLYAAKRKAEKIESEVLQDFRDYRTRGEWLMLPNTDEMRREFSRRVRVVVQRSTGKPVEWRRVTWDEICAQKPGLVKAA